MSEASKHALEAVDALGITHAGERLRAVGVIQRAIDLATADRANEIVQLRAQLEQTEDARDMADSALSTLRAERDGLLDVCEATLMFHDGAQWTQEKQSRWNTFMSKHCPTAGGGGVFERTEATTRNLCNAIRAVLDAAGKEQV